MSLLEKLKHEGMDHFGFLSTLTSLESRESPFPGGGELPTGIRSYVRPFHESCRRTERIKLGTAISEWINQHDPIALAEQVAALDQLSTGRFIFGVRLGECSEVGNHGILFKKTLEGIARGVEAAGRD